MSLVNQMLRDLNARHANEAQATLHVDVRTLPEPSHSVFRRNFNSNSARIIGGSVLALAVLGLAVGGWMHRSATREEAPAAVQQVEAQTVASANPASAPAPSSATTDVVVSAPTSSPRVESESAASSETAMETSPRSAPVKERAEKAAISEKTIVTEKHLEPSSKSKSEKLRFSSGLRVDDTLELRSSRGAERLNSTSVNSGSVHEKNRELNRSSANNTNTSTNTSSLSPPPVLMSDERIVLTRKDPYGQDEKPEKFERAERTEGKTAQTAIEKLDRSERGDDGYHEGVQAYQQGRLKDAVVQLQAVLRENPRHLQARQALLGIYMEYKRYDDALILLQMGLDQMPGQANWAMTMARIQVERGNQAEALATLEKYQVAGERNADYQGFIAVLSQNLRRSHEAVLRYKAALRLKPREGRWWFALGEALEADKRAAEATEAYRQAQSLGGLTPAMNDVLLTKKLR